MNVNQIWQKRPVTMNEIGPMKSKQGSVHDKPFSAPVLSSLTSEVTMLQS